MSHRRDSDRGLSHALGKVPPSAVLFGALLWRAQVKRELGIEEEPIPANPNPSAWSRLANNNFAMITGFITAWIVVAAMFLAWGALMDFIGAAYGDFILNGIGVVAVLALWAWWATFLWIWRSMTAALDRNAAGVFAQSQERQIGEFNAYIEATAAERAVRIQRFDDEVDEWHFNAVGKWPEGSRRRTKPTPPSVPQSKPKPATTA